MRNPSSLEPAYGEAIEIAREEFSGSIAVRLRLESVPADAADDVLSLLSCWWLRWIAEVDCAFFKNESAWYVECRLDPTDRAMLPQVLRDLLAIKNSVCL
ncbi:hypothetical protein [Achromobacter xylosoxidans]|uniref:hypothetical protein n=1 Tax=Alcaligenes xylosoxydans xylosoxydans TaxID=85698 RepID=UPI001F139C53|nr:hypothetical protein [Achromobacter xylosoxidans]